MTMHTVNNINKIFICTADRSGNKIRLSTLHVVFTQTRGTF